MGGKPSAPSPPPPQQNAQAATSTNIGTSVANSFMNNMNQITPDGALNYDVTGNYTWNDPVTGKSYDIPTWTATQTLSEQQKAIKGQQDATKMNLSGLANAQSGMLANQLASPMDLSKAPAAGDPNAIMNGDQYRTTIDPTWDITKSYGPQDSFSADRQRVEDSLMNRINPQLNLQQNKLQQQLSDQGIGYGSAAYNNAFTPFNQQANDARFAAIGQAGDEQARMMQMANQQATFQNAAQNQDFTQKSLAAQFANAGLGAQQAAQQARFNAFNSARGQYIGEQYAARNQPINEINALMSGSQISQPNFQQTPNQQIPTVDVAGLNNQNFSQQMDVYKQESQNYNQLVGGLMGMAGGMMKMGMSDRREKDNIERMATVFAAGDDGERKELPIYSYSFKKDPEKKKHIGPMAQDVEKIQPGAVFNGNGRKYLDHEAVMGSILRAG